MNKFTKDELKAKAAGVFKANPKAEEVYMTTDGQPFLHDVHARSWAAENRTEVVAFTKGDLEEKEAPKPKTTKGKGKGKDKPEAKPEQPAEQENTEEKPEDKAGSDEPQKEEDLPLEAQANEEDPKEEDKK